MSRICPKCGAELQDDELFCCECGTIYEEPAPPEPETSRMPPTLRCDGSGCRPSRHGSGHCGITATVRSAPDSSPDPSCRRAEQRYEFFRFAHHPPDERGAGILRKTVPVTKDPDGGRAAVLP